MVPKVIEHELHDIVARDHISSSDSNFAEKDEDFGNHLGERELEHVSQLKHKGIPGRNAE